MCLVRCTHNATCFCHRSVKGFHFWKLFASEGTKTLSRSLPISRERTPNKMNMLRIWISCFVLTSNTIHHLFSYIICSSLRCWITSWPLWSLSSMEWVSFESTSPTARTRSALDSFHYTVEEYLYVCVYMFFHLDVSSPVKLLFRLTIKKHCFYFIGCSTYRVHWVAPSFQN